MTEVQSHSIQGKILRLPEEYADGQRGLQPVVTKDRNRRRSITPMIVEESHAVGFHCPRVHLTTTSC